MINIIPIGERGLAVTFSKDDLLKLKEGKTLNGELVGPNGKTKLLFMRDRTFLDMQDKFAKAVDEEAAKRSAEQVASEAESIGRTIGNSAESVP